MSQFKVVSTIALTAALAGLMGSGLAGCGPKPAEPAQTAEASPVLAAEPPSLWRVEVLSDGAVVDTVDICADKDVQSGFSRPAPAVNGMPCIRVGEAVETDGTYSVRCRVDDQLYRVGSSTTGDPARDLTVEMSVTRQDAKGPSFEQTRRYRLQGPCPAGWRVGDSGKPGATEVTDGVTGKPRALSETPGAGGE